MRLTDNLSSESRLMKLRKLRLSFVSGLRKGGFLMATEKRAFLQQWSEIIQRGLPAASAFGIGAMSMVCVKSNTTTG